MVTQLVKNAGDLGSIPGLGRSPGGGNRGHLPQYPGLENSMDCIVHGVAKSQTRLSNFHFHFHATKDWEESHFQLSWWELSYWNPFREKFGGRF